MPRILAAALVFALAAFVGSPRHPQSSCTHKPAKRTKAKSKEARAAAQLEKAKGLLNAGKRKQAVKRLRKLVRRYPKTRAALETLIILSFIPEEDVSPPASDTSILRSK